MTKPRRKWPGALDKQIGLLNPANLTHGGAITHENANEFNESAQTTIDQAIYAERIKKLPLLADHYKVGRQNYRGIVEKLAFEFIPQFVGDIDDLRRAYKGASFKDIAVSIAADHVRGFQCKPVFIKPEHWIIAEDIEPETLIVAGYMKPMLAEGRPEIWGEDRLQALRQAVTETKKAGRADTDREALALIARRDPWKGFSLETLEARLQDAKNPKNRKKPKASDFN